MLSASRIYVPHETPTDVGRRYRLRRAVQSACEAGALALFVGGVLAWSWIYEQSATASVTSPTEIAMLAQTTPPPRTIEPAKGKAVAAQMADFITRHVASNGSVDRDDLLLDFTAEQIDANIEAAKRIARNAGKARR